MSSETCTYNFMNVWLNFFLISFSDREGLPLYSRLAWNSLYNDDWTRTHGNLLVSTTVLLRFLDVRHSPLLIFVSQASFKCIRSKIIFWSKSCLYLLYASITGLWHQYSLYDAGIFKPMLHVCRRRIPPTEPYPQPWSIILYITSLSLPSYSKQLTIISA